MNEKLIEKKLREKVKSLKGIAIKFFSPWLTGIPDRMILVPKGRIWFVEIKTTGKKPSPTQEKRIEMLQKLGFKTVVIDDQVSLNNFLEEIQNGI